MLEKEFRLSFYKEIADVDTRHNVSLVQHADTGKIYVKKVLNHYDISVFQTLMNCRFQGIPVISELIEDGGNLIVIEDYINGRSIEERLLESIFSMEEVVSIISDLCDILTPIHNHIPPMVHRDIKASNVIIDNEGKVYLIDFDASRLISREQNRDTELLGTAEYAAPEQYGFGQSDQRTDVYALSILMCKMLTGKFPKDADYSGIMSGIIARATQIDPDSRYQSTKELKDAIHIVSESSSLPKSHSGVDAQQASYTDDKSEKTDAFTSEESKLASVLSHLPYPIRELPGFRSGKLSMLLLACAGYAALIAFGFFGIATNKELTPSQNSFYDAATFFLFLLPILYLSNYMGFRDRLPWRRSQNAALNILRIAVGLLAIVCAIILAVGLIAVIFDI